MLGASATVDSQILLGAVLGGKYRLDAELGMGGFGRVYFATHLQLGSPVAIKVGRNDAAQHLLLREARAAAGLTSPYIARTYDVGTTAAGTLFIVMEYLEGCTLRTRLKEHSRVPPRQALRWCLNVCSALKEAHGKGIVHCDIKPSNWFLVDTPHGDQVAKLVDFGLAKELTEPANTRETKSTAGSPAYMSPERLTSGNATVACDVWSLGVVLFEMLTGERPFVGNTIHELGSAITIEPPRSVMALVPELPPALSCIIERCLRKQPEERYSSIDALAQALEAELLKLINARDRAHAASEDAIADSQLTVTMTLPVRCAKLPFTRLGLLAAGAIATAAVGVTYHYLWSNTKGASDTQSQATETKAEVHDARLQSTVAPSDASPVAYDSHQETDDTRTSLPPKANAEKPQAGLKHQTQRALVRTPRRAPSPSANVCAPKGLASVEPTAHFVLEPDF